LRVEGLVKNFTHITQNMSSVPEIIKAFSEFSGINADNRQTFAKILKDKSLDDNEKKAEALVTKIIACGGLMLCYLEKQLEVTEQSDLYEDILEMDKNGMFLLPQGDVLNFRYMYHEILFLSPHVLYN